tara:strand:- start:1572 stop:3767 length:2196 start_codon:yes stop_codon:yes gene_type:complete
MARLPVPEFDPYKAVTPAASMSDFYRQPNVFQMPESGLEQIASALSPLSRSLNQFIGRRAEAQNEAEMTQGEIEAARMSAEEAREASRGNFLELEKNGTIPKGASPFRLAAMQAAAGRRAVESDLREILNANIQKFSDPNNTEDAASFVQQEFTKLTAGMGFYGQGAATESLDAVERNFLNRTSLLKSERRVEQNRTDFKSDIFNISRQVDDDGVEEGQRVQSLTGRLQERANEYYEISGESGRDEFFKGVSAAARTMANDGDEIEAYDIIAAAEDVVFGDRTFQDDYAIQIQNLRQDVEKRAEAYENGLDEEQRSKEQSRERAAGRTFDKFYVDTDGFRNVDVFGTEFKNQALEYLQTTEGLSETEARLALSDVMQRADRTEPRASPEEFEQYINIISDQNMSKEVAFELLRNLNLPQATYTQGFEILTKRHEAPRVSDGLLRQNSDLIRDALSLLQATLVDSGVGNIDAIEAVNDLRDRIKAKSLSIAEGEGTPDEKRELLSNFISNEISNFKTLPDDVTQPIPKDAAPAIKNAIYNTRRFDMKSDEPFPELLGTTTPFGFDSSFERNLETIQNPDADESNKAAARKNLLSNASARLDGLRRKKLVPDLQGGVVRFPLSEDETLEVLRIRSFVTGFKLEEIKNRKTELFEIEIPEKYLDPRFVILFEMASPENFREFSKTEEGQEQIIKVMEALPAGVKTGTDQEDFNRFVGMQMKLLQRYRPLQGGGN